MLSHPIVEFFITLEMRTEYQMSGSSPVTSREKGGLQERRMELQPFSTLTSPTGASRPAVVTIKECNHIACKHPYNKDSI